MIQILDEREINRISFLVSSICASSHLYQELINNVITRGGSDVFIEVLNVMCEEIKNNNIEQAAKNMQSSKEKAIQQAGDVLNMACYSYGLYKK